MSESISNGTSINSNSNATTAGDNELKFVGSNGEWLIVSIDGGTLAEILERDEVKAFFNASDLALEGDCIFQHIVGCRESGDDEEFGDLTPMDKFQMLTSTPPGSVELLLDIDGQVAEDECSCPGCPNAAANSGKIKVLSSGGQLTYMVAYTEGMTVYQVLQDPDLQAAFAFGEADIKLLDIDLYKSVGGADPTITRIAHNATDSVIVKPGDVISIVGREVACTKG